MQELQRLVKEARAAGETPSLIQGLLAQAEGLIARQRIGEAAPLIEESLALTQACPDGPLIAEAFTLLAALHVHNRARAAASGALAEARRAAGDHYWPLLIPIERLQAQISRRRNAQHSTEDLEQKLLGFLV